MRAAVYHGRQDLRLEEVPEPVAGPGEVKLRVLYNGICGSDLHEYYDGPITTRSAVDGIRRAKFTRAFSMSAAAGTRCDPTWSRTSARTVAHSSPMNLPTMRMGSCRSPDNRWSSVAIATPDIAASATTDSS